VEDLNDQLEKHRASIVEELVREYKKIVPVLTILESYVSSDESSSSGGNVVGSKSSSSAAAHQSGGSSEEYEYIDSMPWHLYSAKYLIAGLERLRQKQQPTAYFDKHLSKCTRLIEHVSQLTPFKDLDFIRIDYAPLIDAIQKQAAEWIRNYAR
jgi:hypothetical protein